MTSTPPGCGAVAGSASSNCSRRALTRSWSQLDPTGSTAAVAPPHAARRAPARHRPGTSRSCSGPAARAARSGTPETPGAAPTSQTARRTRPRTPPTARAPVDTPAARSSHPPETRETPTLPSYPPPDLTNYRYYTRLERGNLTGVSASVLESLARALHLDEAERAHLLDLADAANTSDRASGRPRRAPNRTGVRAGVQRILDT